MSRDDYVKKLKKFWEKEKIGAKSFDCPFQNECSPASIQGVESIVGHNYGDPFNLVILSADIPEDENLINNVNNRKLEVRTQACERDGEKKWNKPHSHFKETKELLKQIFKQCDRNDLLSDGKYLSHFALLNSAKCKEKKEEKDKKNQSNDIFFKNCQQFVMEEIKILEPDILITQGGKALDVAKKLKMDKIEDEKINQYLKKKKVNIPNGMIKNMIKNILQEYVKLINNNIITIRTYHPTARSDQWKIQRDIILETLIDFSLFMLHNK